MVHWPVIWGALPVSFPLWWGVYTTRTGALDHEEEEVYPVGDAGMEQLQNGHQSWGKQATQPGLAASTDIVVKVKKKGHWRRKLRLDKEERWKAWTGF